MEKFIQIVSEQVSLVVLRILSSGGPSLRWFSAISQEEAFFHPIREISWRARKSPFNGSAIFEGV